MTEHIQNAVIESVRLTSDDHGLLSAWLFLDYGGSGQGFGGYTLYLPDSFLHHDPAGPNFAGHFIWRCMEIGGVTEWMALPGKTVRVKQDKPFGSIISIGHIVKNDWFDPKIDFTVMKAEHDALKAAVKSAEAEG